MDNEQSTDVVKPSTEVTPEQSGEPTDWKAEAERWKKVAADKDRAISKWEKRAKENAKLRAESFYDNPAERVETVLEKLVGVLGETYEEHKGKFAAINQELEKARNYHKEVAKWGAELFPLLDSHDVGLDDPEMSDAKAAWDSGRLAEAVSIAKARLDSSGKITESDITRVVEQKVQEKLKELGKVDTGASTAPSGRKPTMADLLAQAGTTSGQAQLDDIRKQMKELLPKI